MAACFFFFETLPKIYLARALSSSSFFSSFFSAAATAAKEINFQTVEVLVLDEVDSLLQLGFEQQVRQVEEGLPAVRQKLFFSATIPPRIEKMATELLQDPLYITVGKVHTICA